MTKQQLYSEFQALHNRMYQLEKQLKGIMTIQQGESNAKIDYIAMMADIELEEKGQVDEQQEI